MKHRNSEFFLIKKDETNNNLYKIKMLKIIARFKKK